MVVEHCDLAFPQIYFEKFRFKPINEEEIQECLKAHVDMQLAKPILPIWGSESDAVNPAEAIELQKYLNQFSGSSVRRVSNDGELGETLKLNYSGRQLLITGATRLPKMPILIRILKLRSVGEDVAALQKALEARGLSTNGVDRSLKLNDMCAIASLLKTRAVAYTRHTNEKKNNYTKASAHRESNFFTLFLPMAEPSVAPLWSNTILPLVLRFHERFIMSCRYSTLMLFS
jgi:hypothetical protein